MKRIIATFLKLIIVLLTATAAIDDLQFVHLTSEEGLSNNTVHCIYQDTKGFLWFGTDDGLDRFDGYDFTVYKYNSADSNSLSSNSVFQIHEDRQGRLWIAAANGVDIFNRQTESFKHVPFVDPDITDRYESYTRAVIEDHEGNILIANTNGIFMYDSLRLGFVRFLKGISNDNTTQQEGIRTMLIDRHNRIWIGSLGYGLYGYDLSRNRVVASPAENSAIRINDPIYTLAEDAEGEIWVGTDNGVYIIQSDLLSVRRLEKLEELRTPNVKNIRKIYIENNTIWIGTDGGGLLAYNRYTEQLSVYRHEEYKSYSLNHNSVQAILKDKQGLLWLGTYQGGINYAQTDRRKKFEYYRNEKGNTNSLIYNMVAAIYEDREGCLWLGTDGGGLDCFNRETNHFEHYVHSGQPNSISGNAILCITEDSAGSIWVGGYLSGINIIHKKTGVIESYLNRPNDPNSLSNNDVRDIFIENDTAVWIATNGGGINLFNPRNGKFIKYPFANGLGSNWCLKIFMDSGRNLWFGTYDGIGVLDAERKHYKVYDRSNDPGSLSNNWVYAFAEDELGNMWVGTANGLNYYDTSTDMFSKVLTSDGLPNEVINGILIHSLNEIWLSTNKGISRFNPGTMSFQNYDEYDGLQGNQYIHGSYFKNNKGEMFFGGLNGFTVFHPDSIQNNLYVPPIYLTDLLLYFKEVEIGGKDSPLQRSITESERIILKDGQSVVTFKYTALNYINSDKNQYAYMMEGLDKDWNNVGSRREATYTNLSPGNYTFRLKASNNDGIWNNTGISLRVTVLPPWYRSILFRILVILFLILLLISFYLYRVSSLKNQKVYLENQVALRTREIHEKNQLLSKQTRELSEINALLEQRTKQIEAQAEGLAEANTLLEERQQQIEEQTEELLTQKEELEKVNIHLEELNSTKDKFFSIIAHDLKNPFNTILGFSELLSKNFTKLTEDKKNYFADIIFKSTLNVFNLLENLLQWSRSQTNRLKFEPSRLELKELINENISLLSETSKAKNISIEYNLQNGETVMADRNMLSTILRNLLTNAVKFSNKGGLIRIVAHTDQECTRISVSDEGVGIPSSEIDKLFRVETHFTREGTAGEGGTGLGLIICKEYINKHKGDIWVESEENKGCTFYFTLPLNQQAYKE